MRLYGGLGSQPSSRITQRTIRSTVNTPALPLMILDDGWSFGKKRRATAPTRIVKKTGPSGWSQNARRSSPWAQQTREREIPQPGQGIWVRTLIGQRSGSPKRDLLSGPGGGTKKSASKRNGAGCKSARPPLFPNLSPFGIDLIEVVLLEKRDDHA